MVAASESPTSPPKLSVLISSLTKWRAALCLELASLRTRVAAESTEVLIAIDDIKHSVDVKRERLLAQARGDSVMFVDEHANPGNSMRRSDATAALERARSGSGTGSGTGSGRLTICVPSLWSRAEVLARLLGCLARQPRADEIEIVIAIDGGQATTGAKRNQLVSLASGAYICHVDDDDLVAPDYIATILAAIEANPGVDVVYLRGQRRIPGDHPWDALAFDFGCDEPSSGHLRNGALVRQVGHLCPVRAELAKATLFPDLTVGEDLRWGKALAPKIRTSARAGQPGQVLYYYEFDPYKKARSKAIANPDGPGRFSSMGPSSVVPCQPYFQLRKRLAAHVAGEGPWAVPDLCRAYSWPSAALAPGGGVIAIVELGGGWTASDMATYFASIGQPVPSITDVSVDGTVNTPGGAADGEVALDIQVAAASYYVATGKVATIRVYWASDIAPAIRAATGDGCDVFSCSWGADEATWGQTAAEDLDNAIALANAAGMIVFAASGDNDSSDGGPNATNVDCPASCPNAIGCGGTYKAVSPPAEGVWNNEPGQSNGSGSGGGYSGLFPMPAWQVTGGAPKGSEGLGRMVPDVAAVADPNTGYEIYFGGQAQVVGGTSAVAPLYAGLCAALGQKLGAAIGARLWAANARGCFADITTGDNGAYKAQVGPDPCTGLGVPIGSAIAALFASAGVAR